ncbi:MAG: hypothetical protein AAFW73_20120 [Bacteroidota bacterium]
MKALPLFLCCLLLTLGLTQCDTPAAEKPAPEATTTTETSPDEATPTTPETQNLTEKRAAAAKDRKGELVDGLTVGQPELVAPPEVDDAGVDYGKIAKAICECGSSFIGKDDQQGPQQISKDDPRYQEAVACGLAKKKKITDKPLNRQTLVRAIKNECNAIPPGLVMSFILSLE